MTNHASLAGASGTVSTDANAKARANIQHLLARYVGQLLHGCGEKTCTETLCHTGQCNTSPRPVRRYTPRSARAIALTMLTGVNPTRHLCPNYRPGTDSEDLDGLVRHVKESQECRHDPLSIMQQLHDTSAIRHLQRPESMIGKSAPQLITSDLERTISDSKLRDIHEVLDQVPTGQDASTVEDTVKLLVDATCSLLSLLPLQNKPAWIYMICDGVISRSSGWNEHGRALYRFGSISDVLDVMESAPFLRALSRIVHLLGDTSDGVSRNGKAWDRIGAGMGLESGTSRSHPPHICTFCNLFLSRAFQEQKRTLKYVYFIPWLKTLFLSQWTGKHLLSPAERHPLELLTCFQTALPDYPPDDLLYKFWNLPRGPDTPEEIRTIVEDLSKDVNVMEALLSNVEPPDLAASWLRCGQRGDSGHLLTFSSIFFRRQVIDIFRAINHTKMQHVHSDADKALTLRSRTMPRNYVTEPEGRLKWLEAHYLLLTVSRENILEDAFNELWQRRNSELLRPLRIRLREVDEFEVGHDLGGVQIEFFNLVCKKLFAPESSFFVTNEETGYQYLRPASLQPLYMFELIGLLFSLALYNGITLPVNFPKALYMLLLGEFHATSDILDDNWPAIARSLQSLADSEAVELDATISFEANGLRLETVAKGMDCFQKTSPATMLVVNASPIEQTPQNSDSESPASENEPSHVTRESAKELIAEVSDTWPGWHLEYHDDPAPELNNPLAIRTYITNYVEWLTYSSISPQYRAFEKGFYTCVDKPTIRTLFTAPELQSLLEGTPHLDIDLLRRVTQYDGYEAHSRYIETFWSVVKAWPEEKQRHLVKFVTAIERFPASPTYVFTFKIARSHPGTLDCLPTSSTCFGTLMLPRYASGEVLDEKLSKAIQFGLEGFGTG